MTPRQIKHALYFIYGDILPEYVSTHFALTPSEFIDVQHGFRPCTKGFRDTVIQDLRDKSKAMIDLAEEISGT